MNGDASASVDGLTGAMSGDASAALANWHASHKTDEQMWDALFAHTGPPPPAVPLNVGATTNRTARPRDSSAVCASSQDADPPATSSRVDEKTRRSVRTLSGGNVSLHSGQWPMKTDGTVRGMDSTKQSLSGVCTTQASCPAQPKDLASTPTTADIATPAARNGHCAGDKVLGVTPSRAVPNATMDAAWARVFAVGRKRVRAPRAVPRTVKRRVMSTATTTTTNANSNSTTNSKTSTSTRASCGSGGVQRVRTRQLVLDAGQSAVGRRTCKQCGLMYSLTDEDRKAHDTYHDRCVYGPRAPRVRSGHNRHVLHPAKDRAGRAVAVWRVGGRLLWQHRRCFREFFAMLREELGAPEDRLSVDVLMRSGATVFLVVAPPIRSRSSRSGRRAPGSHPRMVSCMVVVRPSAGMQGGPVRDYPEVMRKLRPDDSGRHARSARRGGGSGRGDAVCGGERKGGTAKTVHSIVDYMWTHKSRRRHGLATLLAETVVRELRFHEKRELGFSVLSSDGLAFASAFHGGRTDRIFMATTL